MSSCRRLVVVAVVAGLSAVMAPPSVAAPAEGARRYIVVLRDSVEDPDTVAKEHGNKHKAQVSYVYRSALKGYAATISDSKVREVRKDSRVRFVSEDGEVTASAQSLPTGIDRIQADQSTARSGDGSGAVAAPAVAVIDTGSGPHADLNVVGGKNCANGKSYNDGNGHGTHVAGTIGARDNTVGVVGVAPGVPIYSVRVLNNNGSGSWSAIACGLDWVTANAGRLGIKVASMSLGGPGSDDGNCGLSNNDALHFALCGSVAVGVTYVVAAGNEGVDLAGSVPAAYNEALTVTAAGDYNGQPGGGAASTCSPGVDEKPASFSNFTTVGSADQVHTIAAPGVCINSTWKDGGYKSISGTSMATPHVTGVAVLCLAAGACTGATSSVMAKLRSDAAAQPASYGFVGDPANPLPGVPERYYGYMTYAGGY